MKNKKSCLTLSIIVLLLMATFLFSMMIQTATATPTTADVFEPDNDLEHAQVMKNGETQQHNIYPSGDLDWLELRVDCDSKTTIETFGSSGDTEIWLCDLLMQVLAYNDNKGGDYFSKITADLTTGIYYVKIGGKGQIFDYSVRIESGRVYQTTYGGSKEDVAYSVEKTSDGGYVFVGFADYHYPDSKKRLYIVKTDSSGTTQWERKYGYSSDYECYAVRQTSDGGYIIAGALITDSNVWAYLTKMDSNGFMQWENAYGIGSLSAAFSVDMTSDGGYVIVGCTYPNYFTDIYLVKTNSAGTMEWQKTYGLSGGYDTGYSVRQTSDGGYIIAGYTTSFGIGGDVYLVKTDSAGNMLWYDYYGRDGMDVAYSLQITSDGGYIIGGVLDKGSWRSEVYLIKTRANGVIQWENIYGGGNAEIGMSVQQTSDGGYIAAGSTLSFGSGSDEVYLVKTDSAGNMEWQKAYGGSSYDDGESVQQTSDGGYIVAGYTNSLGPGGSGTNAYLVKTDKNGNSPLYKDVILDEGTSIIPKVVYSILHDPPGDSSYSSLVREQTTGWDFTLSAQTTVSVGFEAHGYLFGNGIGASSDFSATVGGDTGKSVEVTTSQGWTSNQISNDPKVIGPGQGDLYVGEAWLLHYRVVDRTYPDGTNVKLVFYGPTRETGFMLSAYQIKRGDVPEPYRSQMLALNPADDNMITDAEAARLHFVETYVYSGGSDYYRSYARTERNTRTFTFDARMSESTAVQLGLVYGPVDATGKVTVSFSFEMGISYETSTETSTRTDFHINDDDSDDTLQFTVWYDDVFGTYVFNASARNIGLWGTSNPREYWDNRAPSASNLNIIPASPTTKDTLTASYVYTDPDGDPQKGYEIYWYKGILQQSAYYNQTSIPAGVAKKGEQWCFFVRPCDWLAYGNWQQSPWLVIANSAPEASSLYILPANPVTTDYLTAHYHYYDIDGDPESGTETRWYKNGVLQPEYNNLLSVSPSTTTKGDVWHFTVKPRDGTAFGTLQTSLTKTILNSGPTATSVYISPSYPADADNLFAAYSYYDADGDPESGSQIRWYKNTILQTAYNDVRTVPASATSSGENWYFTIKPKDGTTLGDTRTSNTVKIDQPPPPPGGGCPYVYTWNGQAYIKDNNILPASEPGNGTDVTDYYKLEQQLTPVLSCQHTSTYTLQIREFESEIDYIDQVKLVAVDHSTGTSIAVTPEGQIVTYMNPSTPLSCVDDEGINRLGEISTVNGDVNDASTFFQGYNGDWLLLNFGRVTLADAKLILRDDQKCCDVCIEVQVPDSIGNWQTIETLNPRDFWSMEAVNLAAYLPRDSDFIVRLLWTAPHRLDYVGLDTSSEAPIKVTPACPTLAVHSALGNVRAKLLLDDEQCVQLINGQWITLTFRLPDKKQNVCRDFLFCTNGYYYSLVQ